MKVDRFITGAIQVNTYLAYDEKTGVGFIVDPGAYCPELTAKAKGAGIENVTAEVNRMNCIPVLDNKAYRPVGAKVPASVETYSGCASGRLHGENISVAADDTSRERLRLETIFRTEDKSCSVLWYSRSSYGTCIHQQYLRIVRDGAAYDHRRGAAL